MKDGFDGNDNLDGSITSDMDATLITSSNNRAGVAHSKESAQDANLVRGARATVLIVLLISAVTVASLAYFLLSLSESESFKAQFYSSADQVLLISNRNAVNVFISLKTMATMYPTLAAESNATLPYVTLSGVGFETIAAGIRNVSKLSYVGYNPILYTAEEINKWDAYCVNHTSWVGEGQRAQNYPAHFNTSDFILPFLFAFTSDTDLTPVPRLARTDIPGPYFVSWQYSPVSPQPLLTNFESMSYHKTRDTVMSVLETGKPNIMAPMEEIRSYYTYPVEGPISPVYYPVYNDVPATPKSKIIAILSGFLAWKHFLDNVLTFEQNDIIVVMESCTVNSTFRINGPEAMFEATGDLHHKKYDSMVVTGYVVGSETEASSAEKYCPHIVHVFPSPELEARFKTDTPLHYALTIMGIFTFAALVFVAYDYFVTTRQSRTEKQADKSNAIVQDMFPGDVAQRLFAGDNGINTTLANSSNKASSLGLSGFGKVDRSTIAELHPEATVLFADISGFTAWSSTRDPHQVFTLLESIFQSFDAIAKKFKVFKVETVGDCYVAVCGVPNANAEHAVVMSRFARSIMIKFRWVCRSLELTLGPDTGELALRVGMHSGPVTAGVLRGDRARFQLFGDTVNTASRVESTGKRERVHISEQTALQLIADGKGDWVVKRDDAVEAKGKGKLVTFWLKLATRPGTTESVVDGSEVGDVERMSSDRGHGSAQWNVEMPGSQESEAGERTERLAFWNSEVLLELLQRIVSRRVALQEAAQPGDSPSTLAAKAQVIGHGSTVVEEVVEVIDMPGFVCTNSTNDVTLSESVVSQLRIFVSEIASMYKDNPFHNFEHASHVTMSVNKLLGRIVAPKIDLGACSDADQQAAVLHDHTCGITSDPLTQFAVVLSALIHDLDHPGVSNGQFMKEDPKLAARYKEKSVAEQNSVDLAWSVLMAPAYDQLRAAIFSTETELRRFRNLLVNSIIATDIFDKDLGTLRKNRWNKAFYETTPEDDAQEVKSRKATIVIEHLIQASDVAHTMQHWHVYQKWNQRLFDEMMMAYRAGRSDKDPSEGWYGGELWFFDNYVIPLAKKLKDCGVFGVSSDEYLNYAVHNRDEWEAKGKNVVQQYLEEFEGKARGVDAASMQPSTRLTV